MAFPPMGVRRCVFIKLSGGALNLYYHRSLEMSIVHKQKIPEPGRKRRPIRGFPFYLYFICTPSIARPRMPA